MFIILKGSFELTVMFFRLMNSPTMFQTIMNWDLINTGKMASFIDDIIIGIKGKEGYDELVEEVVKRLAENDLYVKPEKCK